MPRIAEVLAVRKRRYVGESGCPRAIVTDNSLRDTDALNQLVAQYFPATQGSSERAAVVQDLIHRM
jgi:hypothetical protein